MASGTTNVALRDSRVHVGDRAGDVSCRLLRPEGAHCLFALAHGAGAGMNHPFMEDMAGRLAARGVASFRYQFPYAEAGSRRPDPGPVLRATVRAALAAAAGIAGDLPLVAGGKSMGGRMTSLAAAEAPLPGVRGIAFLGFPLHAAGRASSERADHLAQVAVPMLFLQGTRDALADLARLRPVCERLGERATLHVVEGGDHSFELPKKLGRAPGEIHAELAGAIAAWADGLER